VTAARRVVVEADGGSRGNPGPAGYGAVVRDAVTGEVLAERADGIGVATNNVAEYRGLLAGLEAAAEQSPSAVDVRMDSKLVVEQMSGRWKVRHPDLAPLAARAASLVRSLPSVRFTWIPRESNKHADRLANEAMDAAAAGRRWSPGGAPRAALASPARVSTVDARVEPTDVPAAPAWGPRSGVPTSTLLLRHGQTAHSVDRRFSGRNDLPLTGTGAAQAEAAGARLAAAHRPGDVAAVLTSPLPRARATAQVVARALGLDPVVEDGLVETDFGAWEGLTFAEARERWPEELAAWLASPDVAPPRGETFAEVARRVRRARDRTLAAYPGRTVVLVSHVTPIKTLLRLALDAPPSALYRMHLDLASLSTVDWFPDGPALVRHVNDTAHLGALA
jgi:broad specificity phosphatase PhoE/ribonuclease HI